MKYINNIEIQGAGNILFTTSGSRAIALLTRGGWSYCLWCWALVWDDSDGLGIAHDFNCDHFLFAI